MRKLPDWLLELTIKDIERICQEHMDKGGICGGDCKLGAFGFWDDVLNSDEEYDPLEYGWFGCQCMFACFLNGIRGECI